MNKRFLSVFLFALGVAGAASFLMYRFISAHIQTRAAAQPSTMLLVASHDLEIGTLIHENDIRQAPWSGTIPEQAVATAGDVVGRGVVTKIYKDEPILGGRLAAKGAGAGLASMIPMGKRAVALRVNEVVGLAGFVLPGMRVDVLVAGNAPGGDANRNGTLSRTVLQNLEVLSANQRIERNAEGKPEDAQVVNLLVTPDQAEVLTLASSEAKVQLVLRNPLDTGEQTTHGSSTASLFGVATARVIMPRPQRAPAPKPVTVAAAKVEVPVVEVFSGIKRAEQHFDSGEVR